MRRTLFCTCRQKSALAQDWQESPDFAKLDGKGYVQHYLWNKDTYYFNGHRCKDLDRLNRDLSRVIVVDSDPEAVQLHPENAVMLPRWKGEDEGDTALLDIMVFLQCLPSAQAEWKNKALPEIVCLAFCQICRKRTWKT